MSHWRQGEAGIDQGSTSGGHVPGLAVQNNSSNVTYLNGSGTVANHNYNQVVSCVDAHSLQGLVTRFR